jgi:hypothetical protein
VVLAVKRIIGCVSGASFFPFGRVWHIAFLIGKKMSDRGIKHFTAGVAVLSSVRCGLFRGLDDRFLAYFRSQSSLKIRAKFVSCVD